MNFFVVAVLLDSMEPTALPVDLRHRRADSVSWVPPLPTPAHGPAPLVVQPGVSALRSIHLNLYLNPNTPFPSAG